MNVRTYVEPKAGLTSLIEARMTHLIHGIRNCIYIAKIVLYPKHHHNYLAENACIM